MNVIVILGRVPVQGYRHLRNQSHEAMGWLTWVEKKNSIVLRHAWHPEGEKQLHDAHVWADGYHAPTNTVWSFNGCFAHGHLTCKNNPYKKTTYNPKMKKSMGDLDMETTRWNSRVRQCGYTLVVIYSCQWQAEIQDNLEIREHIMKMGVAGHIEPRSALYGGRTEAVTLHATGDESSPILYNDVVS